VQLSPVVRFVTDPPFVPHRLRPRAVLESFGEAVLWPTVDELLRRVDLTEFVIAHVSIPRIVEAIDMDAVLANVDVSGIADQGVRDLDLPQMIRTSSEALGTDAVVGLRLQSASADDVIDSLKLDRTTARKIVQLMLKENALVKISEEMVIDRGSLDKLIANVKALKSKNPKLGVSEFKDLTGVTRKYAIPLLEYLDRQRVTRRVGDERTIL